MTTNQTLGKALYDAHATYKEGSLSQRRFKHQDIIPLIDTISQSSAQTRLLGHSIEQRAVYEIKLGHGKKNIMLWSQMHGNEPTSTMAIFDMIRFLQAEDEQFSSLRNTILRELELCFIPMLNPDGVERFQRRNAAEVDLNRDALALACPESIILKEAHQKNKPVFGFNLHDQSKYYNVPHTKNTATHSFLAPAYDYEKNVNATRKAAMQGIALMHEVLEQLLPNHAGRYNDDFEPRAFGDNIQSWGTSTILVEAGGLRNDPEKQEIRRLHFSILITLLHNIATNRLDAYDVKKYWAIPENHRKLNDLILRQVHMPLTASKIDISINLEEIDKPDGSFYAQGIIEDLGDLSTFFGYEEFDAKGLSYLEAKIYPQIIQAEELSTIDFKTLLTQGIGLVRLKNMDSDVHYDDIPVLIIDSEEEAPISLKPGNKCAFFLKDTSGIKFAVINGKMIPL